MIEVRNLTKTYMIHERGHTLREVAKNLIKRPMKEVRAVNELSFSVPQGEMLAFLGPNGAGKSTTLKMLTGVLHPTSGEVKALGLVPWKQRREYVGKIGAVFGQKSQLLWDIPPADAFYMNKAIYGVPDWQYRATLDELVELLEVGDVMRKPTRQLSLGERMKCEFIMAMLHRPEIVFLDEPTIGLDMIAKENIRAFVRSMNRQGVTFILTTHDLEDVEMLAERVIVINHGGIVFDDSLGGLRSRVGHKKSVRLTTETTVPDIGLPGLTIAERIGSHEIAVEIDTDLLPLKRFIHEFNEAYGIADMDIESVPIESIMKELYLEDALAETAASGSKLS
ncbi:ATP-binding cassette domain-containing protein [Paenibacillus sp. NEAU-GSW1]|uniref:ABC transporter ATP-binding protein n=1 Tax=Paenibacillus sp. NEAU-GSW1 TaxID=2682486 RepID=UPI0012E2F7E0|nr:ATP-binding cassette domain-containing protein [Paenibacillus sp. NEAU-GSW1]MUT65150.1 ATP-binding cassette domain-containing protein [Paenibacillus sp. NEAU-GSW1]